MQTGDVEYETLGVAQRFESFRSQTILNQRSIDNQLMGTIVCGEEVQDDNHLHSTVSVSMRSVSHGVPAHVNCAIRIRKRENQRGQSMTACYPLSSPLRDRARWAAEFLDQSQIDTCVGRPAQ